MNTHGVVISSDFGDVPGKFIAQYPIISQADPNSISFGDFLFDLQCPVEKRPRQRNIGRISQVFDAAFDRNLFERRQPILPDRYVKVHRIHFERR